MVVQRGNAPRSFAYQANALLLSYGTDLNWRKASVVRRPPHERILFSRQVQPAYICLPSKLAARVGLAPTPCGLTNRCATLTPPGNGAAGRIPTCIVPIRSRMPMCSTTAALQNWSAWQELHLRSPGPKPGALATTLHADRNWRIRRDLHPQPSRRQRAAPLIELRVRNGGKRW